MDPKPPAHGLNSHQTTTTHNRNQNPKTNIEEAPPNNQNQKIIAHHSHHAHPSSKSAPKNGRIGMM